MLKTGAPEQIERIEPAPDLELRQKLEELQKRIAELESKLAVLEKEDAARYKKKMEEYFNQIKIYRLLVSKYKDYIETSETKNVADLKKSVQPTNPAVLRAADNIKFDFENYMLEKDLLNACEKAHKLVEKIPSSERLGITFWMTIDDIVENNVADYEDKAIFLCSLFRALGGQSRILIVELSDGSNRPLVLLELAEEKAILFDPNTEHDFYKYFGRKDDLIAQYSCEDKIVSRVLYEFNDDEYVSYEEERDETPY